VDRLRDEKQFRVIKAMAESTAEGKKKFLRTLRSKFAAQQAQLREVQAKEGRDMESFLKRKQELDAQQRVKMLNPAATRFHSSNAIVGAKENAAGGANGGGGLLTAAALAGLGAPGSGVSRSLSSSSVTVTKEDISQVGALLGNAHISDSEMNLRQLEISKKGYLASSKQPTVREDGEDGSGSGSSEEEDSAKRDRPQSIRQLTEGEQKPLQRTRSDQEPAASMSTTGSSESVADEGGAADEDPEAPSTKRWTKSQDAALRESVRIHGEKNRKAIAELVPGRNHAQCLQRWRKVLKPGLVKGHWSFEEDQVLEYLVTQGCNNWGQIAERIPGRTPKQCRERWKNHLDPAINKGPYTEEEDAVILSAQARLGNKWSQIATLLKGRTEDSVKIRWKSLKQNPSKAAASHAQHKKNQQAAAAQQQARAAMGAYANNPALMRQLLQQQQSLDQHNVEAVQQLEQQQQMQQMRLHEKLLQQQQMQAAGHVLVDDGGLKADPYASRGLAAPPMGMMGMMPALPTPPGAVEHSPVHEQMYTGGYGYGQYEAAEYAAGYDPRYYRGSTASSQSAASPANQQQQQQQQDQSPPQPQGEYGAPAGDLGRIGEHPPATAAFWETYPRQDSQLSPLSLQVSEFLF
jgi:hypothetical protein